jgi:hypothetical protein
MKLSLMGCAAVAALGVLAAIPNTSSAAEKKGQGCDLRVAGSGCEPGAKNVHPATKYPTAPESRHDSNSSGRDPQQHNTPQGQK